MKKRVLSLALALILCLGLTPAVSATQTASNPGMFRYGGADTFGVTDADVAQKKAGIYGLAWGYSDYRGPLHIPGKVKFALKDDGYGGYDLVYDESGEEWTVTRVEQLYPGWQDQFELTDVTLGEGITELADCTFYANVSMTSVTLPESLTTIGWGAFLECSSLKRIHVPAGVTEIGFLAFYEPGSWKWDEETGTNIYTQPSLTEISVSENNPNYASQEGVLFNKDKTQLICYPAGKAGAYVIPDGVTEVAPAAFARAGGLTSLTIPASVTKLSGERRQFFTPFAVDDGDEVSTFLGCSALTSVTILSPTIELIDDPRFEEFNRDNFYSLFPACETIYGYNGSTAETYAAEHNITFVSLGDAPGAPASLNETGTLGQNGELAWEIKNGVLTVTGALGATDMVVAACENEEGRFIGTALVRAGQPSADLPAGAAAAKLFWLDEDLAPKCPCVQVSGSK